MEDHTRKYDILYKYKPKPKTVVVEFAPISERYWQKGDKAIISNNKIRLSGCWFSFDDRYVVQSVCVRHSYEVKHKDLIAVKICKKCGHVK